MGLDTTHDCWHGPYSAFMQWRAELHRYIHPEHERTLNTIDRLNKAWEQGLYDDQSEPINILMNHSDCDGRIHHEDTLPLAHALELLLGKIPARGLYDRVRPATERFIKGLRMAHEAGEDVLFR